MISFIKIYKSRFCLHARRIIVGCLATIGAFALLVPFYLYSCGFMSVGMDYMGSAIYSPDKKYKAILFNVNGGGGISPYCMDAIAVAPASIADKAANAKRYVVYRGGCCKFRDYKTNSSENCPVIRWLSNNGLQITFSAIDTATGIGEMMLKGHDHSGRVMMVYKTREDIVPIKSPTNQ